MTIKATDKNQSQKRSSVEHSEAELQAAHECHTLAQMLYGQVAALQPWVIPPVHTGVHPPAGSYASPQLPLGWPCTQEYPQGWAG